ncbi:MAG: hypothetical protein HYZ25_13615 [Chloroflexi bacterium]|nr:hypothetical protein [Chloroflexota bacterium]
MFNHILENLKTHFQEESLPDRSKRMIPAALYGALIATLYTFTLTFVNVVSYPKLPLGVDWPRTLGMWVGYSLAFAAFGAIAAWFTEEYAGIVGGGIIFTLLLVVVFLVQSGASNSTITMQSIITAIPLVGVNMLAAWGLRWAAHRHLTIQQEEPKARRQHLTRHILIVVLIGFVPGFLGHMDSPAEQSLTQLHTYLQAAPTDSSAWSHLPLKKVPALQDHFGVDYKLYPRWSALSAGALDVTVRFADGYVMTCLLPVGSGSNFITDCNEGETIHPNP